MIRKANIRYSWKGFAIPLLLLALTLLTACTDYDALLPTKAEEPSQSERLSNADSLFLNLSIVSNVHTTRATEAEESAIYDGILCIFEGSDAATATLKTATVIDQLISNPNPSGATPRVSGTETGVNITQRLAEGTHAYGSNLYVLALLNTTETGFKVVDNSLIFNGAAIPDANSDNKITYSDIQALSINSVGNTDEHVGLYMTNTSDLVPITPANHLFDTEIDAVTNFSTGHLTINVSRAAAKVVIVSGLSSGDDITNITLNGTSTKAKFHTMRWMLTPEPGYTDEDFTDFHQKALESGQAVYVKPGTSSVVVELQVKDGSFLIDEAYRYQNGNDIRFYTSTKPLVEFFKEGWTDTFHYHYSKIGGRTAAEVFRHPAFYINDDGSVNLTLTNDSFTGTGEQDDLATLANVLKGFLSGYRDAKMYYTFSIGNLASNNSYTLTFDNSSISGIGRPTPTPAP